MTRGRFIEFIPSAGASRPATAVSGVTKLAGDRQDKSTRWRMAEYGFLAALCFLIMFENSAVLLMPAFAI
ncbi:MAG: hypothetical protein C4570_01705 [Ammonifex sp.]|nr:MAG: hypothetical protein C4570_01705 [Ammonifex sp.]